MKRTRNHGVRKSKHWRLQKQLARTEKLNDRDHKPTRPGLVFTESEEASSEETALGMFGNMLLGPIRRWRSEREERRPQG